MGAKGSFALVGVGVIAALNDAERASAKTLIELALAEDLRDAGDLTCQALIDPTQQATVAVVSRQAGVLCGGTIGWMVFESLDSKVNWKSQLDDGANLQPGSVIARVSGPLASILTGERTALNFLTHLSGVASITRRYVDAVAGTGAEILDTRKTHPGYRLLEKYAVRCGGGRNHRVGLFDGIMIKDNHLAGVAVAERLAPGNAVRRAREWLQGRTDIPVVIEVDTLDQLRDALPAEPDQILLDNMPPAMLCEAVALRNEVSTQVELEASGGINLETVRAVAETGVERISVGAITHSVKQLDIGFDWPT